MLGLLVVEGYEPMSPPRQVRSGQEADPLIVGQDMIGPGLWLSMAGYAGLAAASVLRGVTGSRT